MIIFIFSLSRPFWPVLTWKEAIILFSNLLIFFCYFFGILYYGSSRNCLERYFLFTIVHGLSQPVLAWKEAIMICFNFLNFFGIFLEFSFTGRVGTVWNDNFYFLSFSITSRVGTDRDNNFYFHFFSAFPHLFWLETMP